MESPKGMRAVSLASVVLALLQSLCTAVLTINSVRLESALPRWPPQHMAGRGAFHRDASVSMLTIGGRRALVNLGVLFWIWHLRARPEAQWRVAS